MSEHSIIKLREMLVEGKALSVSEHVRSTARRIAAIFENKFFRKFVPQLNPETDFAIGGFSEEGGAKAASFIDNTLNTNRPALTVDGGKYGKKRLYLNWTVGPLGTMEIMGSITPVDAAIGNPELPAEFREVFMLAKRYEADYFFQLALNSELLAYYASNYHDEDSDKSELDTIKASILASINRTAQHELTHIMDPKLTSKFTIAQNLRRTRKGGYNPGAYHPFNPAMVQHGLPMAAMNTYRYVTSPHEMETWSRDVARLVITDTYRATGSMTEVEKVVRDPTGFHHISMLLPTKPGLKTFDFIRDIKRSKNKWRKFMLTLLDEFKVFKHRPQRYMRYSMPDTGLDREQLDYIRDVGMNEQD